MAFKISGFGSYEAEKKVDVPVQEVRQRKGRSTGILQ